MTILFLFSYFPEKKKKKNSSRCGNSSKSPHTRPPSSSIVRAGRYSPLPATAAQHAIISRRLSVYVKRKKKNYTTTNNNTIKLSKTLNRSAAAAAAKKERQEKCNKSIISYVIITHGNEDVCYNSGDRPLTQLYRHTRWI